MIINNLKQLWAKVPKPDSISLSWPPSINFPFKKNRNFNNLLRFEELLAKAKWWRETIGHKEIWINEEDNTFQIEHGDYEGEFRESWLEMYPDPVGAKYPVYLKINNAIIKELTFILCDGGRIFVPMPERNFEGKKVIYTWERNSLLFKVCNIIGQYYIYNTIEGIAQVSKIDIT